MQQTPQSPRRIEKLSRMWLVLRFGARTYSSAVSTAGDGDYEGGQTDTESAAPPRIGKRESGSGEHHASDHKADEWLGGHGRIVAQCGRCIRIYAAAMLIQRARSSVGISA